MLDARDICGCATGRNGWYKASLEFAGRSLNKIAGGQLRPHAYSRYLPWKERFGADGALELIRHEMAHLSAFKDLAEQEGITEEVALKFGETFDAAMTDEAWERLKGNYEAMKKDHGEDNEVVKSINLIEDAAGAEAFSQMKGALAAITHPAGQM